MGKSEENLKLIESFCDLDLEATSTPCECPSDDEEYQAIYPKISAEVQRQRKEAERKLAELPDIYYGTN